MHDNAVALCAAEPLQSADESVKKEEKDVDGIVEGSVAGDVGIGVQGGSIDLSNKFAHATNHCVQKRHSSADHSRGGVTESNSFTLQELCKVISPLPSDFPTPVRGTTHTY